MDLREIADYSNQCLNVMGEFLDYNQDCLWDEFETLSEFNSIGKLVAHCVGAEQRWTTAGLREESMPARYEENPPMELSQLLSDYKDIRAKTMAALDGDDLEKVVEYTFTRGKGTVRLKKSQILFHLFNHQSFHFGQISTALQREKIDPPYFDFVLMHLVS